MKNKQKRKKKIMINLRIMKKKVNLVNLIEVKNNFKIKISFTLKIF